MIDVYDFGGQKVRIVIRDGEPWFVAVDVCRALAIVNSRDAIGRLEKDGVGTADVTDSLGRSQPTRVLSEPALYELIFQSRVPKAAAFRRWVTHEVIPAIRKTGSYGKDPIQALSDPVILRNLLGNYAERVQSLEAEAETSRPKVEVYDRIVESGDTVGFREACKLIRAGTGAKENEFRAFLFKARWVQRLGGRLAPASYGQDQDYVTSREKELTLADGGTIVIPELRITQRGVAQAVKRLNGPKAVA